MDRRDFLKRCAAAGGGFLFSNQGLEIRIGAKRPNIILCMSDDQGWHETGYYGHPILKTPALDQLSVEGLRFDRFYSAAPVCSPTRGSVMTGRHPNRYGCLKAAYSIRPEEITIADLLKNKGYATGHFGKWHLGPVKDSSFTNPGKCGFDTWLSNAAGFNLDPSLSRDGGERKRYEGEGSEIIVDAAIDFIEENKQTDKPFFVVVWFSSPHGGYFGIEEDLALYEDVTDETLKNRYAEITAMDRAIGDLRNYLWESGLTENTLLWFCSDNGGLKNFKDNTDLRGWKGNLYEGGIKVPCILTWPAVIKKPKVTDVPCVTSDIFPTLCELFNIKLPERIIDGISLVDLINGDMSERPASICFWEYDYSTEVGNEPWLDPESQSVTGFPHQFENYKHPVPKTENFGGDSAIMGNQYKLVITTKYSGSVTVELFDILADPNETTDLAAAEPTIVSDMRAELETWQASVEESLSGYDYT